jgi:tetratricopeptide (TPR) repeat protein
MKKIITLLVVILISSASFAQKSELKAAQKSLDANNFTEAISLLKGAESLIAGAKDKYKTQYYFLLGKAFYANGTNPDGFVNASKAFNTLLNLEDKGTKKYSNEVGALLNTMVQNVADKASTSYNEGIELIKDDSTKEEAHKLFSKAGKNFEQVYVLSKKDTAFLQNAGLSYYFAEEYNKSVDTYQSLLDTGYTGISTSYSATSVVNDQKVSYTSKKDMDGQVKLKLVKDPQVVVRKSQRNELIKMIAKNYIALKDNEKALTAILEAKKVSPNDYGLLVDEANIYYAMGDNKKFKEKLEEAVKINPTDETLHYNIGVMKMELGDNVGAIESFNEAIKLKPDYGEAYNNIGAAILTKAEAIVEEMNNSLSDFNKYDRLQAQQFEVYKEAMPYYEKAFEFDKSNKSIVQTLLGIYENLEMNDKLKEMKAVYDTMRN